MAPFDRLHLPFRWEFAPVRHVPDGSIRWQWKAYTHSGTVAMQSDGTFETLTDCMNDARKHGYGET